MASFAVAWVEACVKGRWRLFRHEAGQQAGPPAWAYVVLYGLCLLVGLWSSGRFDAVVLWPANGVLLAALLQLHRRTAIPVALACVALNLAANALRGDPMPFFWLCPALNLTQIGIAGILARRFCGAALDLRRPRRLLAYALLAIVPAVLLTTAISTATFTAVHDFPLKIMLFVAERTFAMEALGLFTVTPILMLLARRHRFGDFVVPRQRLEVAALFGLLGLVTAAVFVQSSLPLMFLIFPPLLLLLFRATPTWAAASVILITLISGFSTLNGHGPIVLARLDPDLQGAVPAVMQRLNVLYAFMTTVVAVALPVSTVVSERHRLLERMEARRAAAHAARRRAEAADAAKSRFLAVMSHEMRTPLHGVLGHAEVLSRRSGLTRDVRAQLDQIQASGAALLTLVEDVLEVTSDAAEPSLSPVALPALLDQAAAASRDPAAAKGLDLVVAVQPGAEGPVLADGRRVRLILHRLIGNAVKFTPTGRVEVTAEREGADIVLRVKDTGPGVDPSLHASLFQPLVQGDDSLTRAHVGAGLGLAVAARMTDSLGGTIALEATSREGSTFVVRLPLALVDDAASDPADPRPSEAAGTSRVLVVDDHPTNREVARLMLAPLGCQIREAVDGIEAVELASTTRFDLILMDVRMPRMDGLAATRAIRALPRPWCDTPILAVTADAMPEDVSRCLDAGMDGHLAKPLTHAGLFAAIAAVMPSETEVVPRATVAG